MPLSISGHSANAQEQVFVGIAKTTSDGLWASDTGDAAWMGSNLGLVVLKTRSPFRLICILKLPSSCVKKYLFIPQKPNARQMTLLHNLQQAIAWPTLLVLVLIPMASSDQAFVGLFVARQGPTSLGLPKEARQR